MKRTTFDQKKLHVPLHFQLIYQNLGHPNAHQTNFMYLLVRNLCALLLSVVQTAQKTARIVKPTCSIRPT